MVPGIDVVIRATNLVADLKGAEIVFTAEGRIDRQSAMGKVPTGVALAAKKLGATVIALAGEVADDCRVVFDQGIDAVLSIAPGPITLDQSMAEAEKLLANAAECAMRFITCRVKR
jgi:glycerate kinase